MSTPTTPSATPQGAPEAQTSPGAVPSPYSAKSAPLLELLKVKFDNHLLDPRVELGDVVIGLDRTALYSTFETLKKDPSFLFDMLVDLTAVDWMDARAERFEVVYHLMSIKFLYRLRVKVLVPESDAVIDSVVPLWAGANFMERETWDMYGVVFRGHPDLRRLLLYEEFKGHPLRKDYPVQAKQPRIPLRSPEVRNTATDRVRAPLMPKELVQINSRKRNDGAAAPKN